MVLIFIDFDLFPQLEYRLCGGRSWNCRLFLFPAPAPHIDEQSLSILELLPY